MSVNELSIEQLLAQAREKEASVQRDREQKAVGAKQAIVTTQVEKLYSDWEDQVRRQAEIAKNYELHLKVEEKRQGHRAELIKLAQMKKEANERIADENMLEDVKDIYRQVIAQSEAKEAELNAIIKQAYDEDRHLSNQSDEHRRAINASTKEAAELMGYGKNSSEIDHKAEFIPDKDFEQIADYVQNMRELKARAKEGEQKIDVDKLAESIWKQIQSNANKRTRSSGMEGYVHDLDSNRVGKSEALLDNPLLVTKIREKVFEKVKTLEEPAAAENWRGKTTDLFQKAMQTEVFIEVKDAKGGLKKIQVWAGGHFNPTTSYSSDSEQLPYFPGVEVTDDQKAKINQAIENPNIPLQELKTDLGIKYEPETVARIQVDAQKENEEVDRKRELKKLEGKIEGLARDIKNLEESMARSQQSLIILEKNFQYSKTETESTQQGNEVHSLKQELERAKREIANLPKGIFGGVKDKEKQRSLSQRISEIDKLLPEKEKISNATKDRLEQIRQELGKDFHQDYYDSGHQLKDLRSRLETQQKQLDEYKAQLGDLQRQHLALENK